MERVKTGDDNFKKQTDYAPRKPQMLKKPEINNVCAEKQSAVKPQHVSMRRKLIISLCSR